jgi:ABC-2 type transport system permease protein
MLWYKAWLETRWRFLIGLVLLMASAIGVVMVYPRVQQLMPLAATVDIGGEIGRRIREAAELSRDYRGYIWSQWFRQNLVQLGTLFAVLLGIGGLLSQRGDAVLFTLSMPVSRNRLIGVRVAVGLAELLLLSVVPPLVIPLVSPSVGQNYDAIGGLFVHGLCAFVACGVFFSLAFLLSTIFNDVWRPLLIALGFAVALAFCEQFAFRAPSFGVFEVMSGESYFRTGAMPWLGLLMSATASSALLSIAAMNVAGRDF